MICSKLNAKFYMEKQSNHELNKRPKIQTLWGIRVYMKHVVKYDG